MTFGKVNSFPLASFQLTDVTCPNVSVYFALEVTDYVYP